MVRTQSSDRKVQNSRRRSSGYFLKKLHMKIRTAALNVLIPAMSSNSLGLFAISVQLGGLNSGKQNLQSSRTWKKRPDGRLMMWRFRSVGLTIG